VTDAALYRAVAARYRVCGRFAFHYVASKLRRDPLTAAMLALGRVQPFGAVVDIGCGRGQFAALLLEAGLAHSILGIERNAALLEQAHGAMRGLPFEGQRRDLTDDARVPSGETILLLDVLYQLPTHVQTALLEATAAAARHRILIRMADPSRGWRAHFTRFAERAARRIWPNAGATVNARPVDAAVEILRARGYVVTVAPCWAGTPFSNVIVIAERDDDADCSQNFGSARRGT
jgi:trans-aconitate methyltransferase